MSKFMNGHIVSITEEIADDVETVLEFVRECSKDNELFDKAYPGLRKATDRLEVFLATYNGDEGDHINGIDDGEEPAYSI